MKMIVSSKSILFMLFLAVFVQISTFAEQRTEERVVTSDAFVEFRPINRPEAKFSISDNLLKLDYIQEMRGTTYNEVSLHEYTYERKNKRSEWVQVKDTILGSRKDEIKSIKDTYKKVLINPNGCTVKISVGKVVVASIIANNGVIIITDELANAILNETDYHFGKDANVPYINVDIPELSVYGRVNIDTAPFFTNAVSEAQTLLAPLKKSSVTNSSTYETYAKSILTIKSKSSSPFLLKILKSELDSVGVFLIENFNKELEPLQDKFPEFIIVGTIQDFIEGTEATTFQIYGTTLPTPQTNATFRSLGYQNKKCNIRVIISNSTKNSEYVTWYGKGINISGKVYYAGRETAKSIDGTSVPLYVYYEPMKSTSSLIPGFDSPDWKRLQTLKSQIDSIKKIYSQYAELLS